jgi:predicted phosphoribosyltransferase
MAEGPGQEHVSRRFPDRRAAGEALAGALKAFGGQDTLVLGIPRGGVIVAAEVARLLQAEFDAAVSRKLEAPGSPELAMGAVTAAGSIVIAERTVLSHDVTPEQLELAISRGAAEAAAQQARFGGDRPAPRLANRTVIVVDDGLATGATMRAALREVRGAGPGVLVAAVPVGDPEACAELHADADAVVCLHVPASFSAVSSFYDDFRAPDDETVRLLLQEFPAAITRPGACPRTSRSPER